METEALIVGAGPAGITTALHLVRDGIAVCLVSSSSAAAADRIDILSPETKEELAAIGIDGKALASMSVPCHGIDATWGQSFPVSHTFLHHPCGDGIAIRRSDFDKLLLDHARNSGTDFCAARFLGAEPSAVGWRARFEGNQINMAIDCRVIVDATGRVSAVSRYMGARLARHDALASVGSLVQTSKRERILSVASMSYGWWYSTPAVDGRAFVCCVSDADVLRQLRLTQREVWLSLLQPVASILSIDALPTEVALSACPCESAALDLPGSSWIAIGDAAARFDPLAGTGILHALRSGRRASHAIADYVRRSSQALLNFGLSEREVFRAYLRGRQSHYGLEQRFLEHEFWLRRGKQMNSPLLGDTQLRNARELQELVKD